MKKTILSLLAAGLLSLSGMGQNFIGGNLGISLSANSTKTSDETTKGSSSINASLSPTIGYFISDNLAAGASVSYQYTLTNNRQDPTSKSIGHTISFSPFVRAYILNVEKLRVMTHASLGLGYGIQKNFYDSEEISESKTLSITPSVRPGVSYAITPNIDIEAFFGSLSYVYSVRKNDDNFKNRGHYFNLSLSSSISLGFIYKF